MKDINNNQSETDIMKQELQNKAQESEIPEHDRDTQSVSKPEKDRKFLHFNELGIIEEILKVIAEEGFEKPSEIQEKTIPLVTSGKDVIAGSATGSGKTLAFGSGIIQNTEKRRGIQALVITPTRELAEQISQAFKKFSKYKPLRTTVVYGGVSINPQIERLKTTDIVVGTPGRLLDHLERRTIDLSKIKTLVLDEADRMLDMGFIDDVEKITRACPKHRQTLLFSATIPPDIAKLADNYMNNPIKVSAKSYVDPNKLHHIYYDVPDKIKFSLLVHLMKKEHPGLIMVFCNSQRNTDFVARNLKSIGISAQAIHGGLTQAKRELVLKRFNEGKVNVMVCTDVAARGLDIKGVSHVYNYDIPLESKQYIHRVGRTARAGEKGMAINILAQRDHDNFSRILHDFAVDIKKQHTPKIQRVAIKWKDKPRGRNSPMRRRRTSPSANRRKPAWARKSYSV